MYRSSIPTTTTTTGGLMQRLLLVPVLAACAALTLPAAAQAQNGSPAQNSDQVPTAPPPGGDPIVQYNRELLAILRTPGAQPATIHPTRSLALVHVAQYDAVEAIDGRYALYGIKLKVRRRASRTAAADAAAHDVLVALYPAMKDQLDQDEAGFLSQVPDGPRKTDGITVGSSAAQKVLALRANDNATATPPAYTSSGAPGDFAPTPPSFAAPVFTHWSQVTPWVLTSAGQFRPPPPPALTDPKYTAAYNEVKSLGMSGSTTRTDDQTQVGRFWGAPIQNYWNEIAQTAALTHHATLDTDARLFAQLNLAFADGVIAFYDA
jgi:hypothetical protein